MNRESSQDVQAITVSFFSPRDLLLEAASAAPGLKPNGMTSVTIALPRSGVVHIPNSESEGWRHGLALSSARTKRFIEQVKHGEVPHPIRPALRASYIPTSYCSPDYLVRTSTTVADALHITPLLVDFVLSCTETVCPHCSAMLPLFASPKALLEEIVTHHSGHSVSIALLGRAETVESWAINRGFTSIPSDNHLTEVAIDSFMCSPDTVHSKADLLAGVLSTDGVALRCKRGDITSLYGLSGACLQCRAILPQISRATATAALRSNLDTIPHALRARSERGISVNELVSAPLGGLSRIFHSRAISGLDENHRSTDLISATLKDDIVALKLERRTLRDKLIDLPNRDRALLSTLSLVYDDVSSERIKILDLPERILGTECGEGLESILRRSSTTAPFIVLGEPSAPPLPPLALAAHSDTSPSTVYIPPTPRLKKTSGLVAHALGLSEPLAALFAASHEARIAGLNAKSFQVGLSSRGSGSVCVRCNGYGFIIDDEPGLPVVDAEVCQDCCATRFIPPVSGIRFRGLTLGQLYNGTLNSALSILRALPKARDAIALSEALGLLPLALGMPLALLEPNEQRLALLAQAILRSTATKPSTIVIEDSGTGFSAEQHRRIQQLIGTKTLLRNATVCGEHIADDKSP